MTQYRIRFVGVIPAFLLALTAAITQAQAVTVSLPGNTGAAPGASVVVPVSISSAAGVLGTDIILTFDPAVATAQSVSKTPLSSPHTLTINNQTPGILRISLFGATPLSGSGVLLNITFRSEGPAGGNTVLHFDTLLLNEGQIPATPSDGHFCVQGRPGEVQDLEIRLSAPGSGEALLAWGAVQFAQGYNVYRGSRGDLVDLGCSQSSVGATSASDDAAVAPGALFVYLVTAVNCSDESTLGYSSAGQERSAPTPCP